MLFLVNPVLFVYIFQLNLIAQIKSTLMDIWGVEPCRACLHHEDATTMYSLRLPETLKLFNECSNSNISLTTSPSEKTPKYLCSMCYRLCELWQTFRKRCQETEQKLKFDSTEVVPEEPVPTKTLPKQEQEDEWEDYSDDSQDIHMDPLAEEDSSHSAKDEPEIVNSSSEPAMTVSELCLCNRDMRRGQVLLLNPCHHLIHSSCWKGYTSGEKDMPCPYCGGLLVGHSEVQRRKNKKHSLEDRRRIYEAAQAGESWQSLAQELGISRSTAESWIDAEKPLKRGGKPCTLSSSQVERIMEYLKEHPKATLTRLHEWVVKELGTQISMHTVKRSVARHVQKSIGEGPSGDTDDSHLRFLQSKWCMAMTVPDNLVWGPGPNDLGVWKHFLRDSTKSYAKCLWPDCPTVLHCPKNNTNRMRNHVAKFHSSSVPPRRLDTRAAPVQWKAFQ